jgi:hypothetical protein
MRSIRSADRFEEGLGGALAAPSDETREAGLPGFGGPLRVVLDAERLHLVELLVPEGLLLVETAPFRDLVPLAGG